MIFRKFCFYIKYFPIRHLILSLNIGTAENGYNWLTYFAEKLFDVEKGQLVNKLGFDNQVRFKIVNASCVRDLHKSDTN